jgi:hypothetical protein
MATRSHPELDNGLQRQPYVNQYVVGQREQSARSDNQRKAIIDCIGELRTESTVLPIDANELLEKRFKLASERREKLLSNPIVEVENSPSETSPGELKTETEKEVEMPVQTPEQAQELKPKKEKKKLKNPFKAVYNAVDKALDWMVSSLNKLLQEKPKPKAPESVKDEWEGVMDGIEDSNPQSDPDLSPEMEAELAERDAQLVAEYEAMEAEVKIRPDDQYLAWKGDKITQEAEELLKQGKINILEDKIGDWFAEYDLEGSKSQSLYAWKEQLDRRGIEDKVIDLLHGLSERGSEVFNQLPEEQQVRVKEKDRGEDQGITW